MTSASSTTRSSRMFDARRGGAPNFGNGMVRPCRASRERKPIMPSQLRTHPHIDRERLRRRDHAGVVQHVRYCDRDRRVRIEESAEGREFAIEQVVYDPIDFATPWSTGTSRA